MKHTRNLFVVTIALFAGFVGGQIGLLNKPLLATNGTIEHKEIVTQSLKIVDSNNKTRALLGVAPEGLVGFALTDSNQQPRCLITVDKYGAASVSLFDAKQKIRCMMSSSVNGQPLIALNDENQNTKFGLILSEDNLPSLELYGSDNQQCVEFNVNKHGPKLTMLSAKGSRCVLGISPSDEPGLHMLDKKGVVRSSLLFDQNDSPSLQLFDSSGQQRGGFAIESDGMTRLGFFDTARKKMRGVFGMDANGVPALLLIGENGKVITSLP